MKTAVHVAVRVSMLMLGVGLALLPLEGRAQYSGNYQTNTISGVTNNWAGDYVVGNSYVGDVLFVQSAGVLNNTAGYLGYAAGAVGNRAMVSGTGSVWNSSGELDIGRAGSGNALTITNGGLVVNADGYIGRQNGASNNTVLVGGSGSVWSNSAALSVGYYGVGDALTISNGGAVFNTIGVLGYQGLASSNTVLVTGSGSVWNNRTNLYVGYGSFGNSLTIANSGLVVSASGYLGEQGHADNNTVLVTGSGSVWSNSADLYIGNHGVSDGLTITNGGAVFNSFGYLGYQNDAKSNSVLVTGSGSVWNNNTNLYVGYMSVGNSLRIANSGGVFSAGSYIGYSNSAKGNAILVTDTGSVFSNSADLCLGYNGSGNTLTITNGGAVHSANGYIGYNAGSTGNSVKITGPGSAWNSGANLYVGYGGANNGVTIINAGTNDLGALWIGYNSNAAGSVSATGTPLITEGAHIGYRGAGQMTLANCSWSDSGSVTVGDQAGSRGEFVMTGGTASLPSFTVGNAANSTGAVVVSDVQLSMTSVSTVGNNGIGLMTISNSTVQVVTFNVGSGNGVGTLTLIDSTVRGVSSLSVASTSPGGTGTVWMTGGEMDVIHGITPSIMIGLQPESFGQMTVSNAAVRSWWVNLGYNSPGTLTVADGGSVKTTTLEIYPSGTLFLAGGQLLTTNSAGMKDGSSSNTVYPGVCRFYGGQMIVSAGTWLGQDAHIPYDLGSGSTPSSTLIIAGGANVLAGNLRIGCSATSATHTAAGVVSITGGLLATTNAPTLIGGGPYGFGQLTASGGAWQAQDVILAQDPGSTGVFTIAGGNVTLNHLIITNSGSQFAFNSGTLGVRGMALPTPSFTVGDGVHAATLNLLDGERSWNTYSLLVPSNCTLNLAGMSGVPGAITNFGAMVVVAPSAQLDNTLNNIGTLVINPDSLLTVIPAWTNAGTVTLGDDSILGGGAINNTGLIQGGGIVNAALVNGPGGSIQLAVGDWLTLRDPCLNQGTILNLGGILDVLANSFTNTGVISGYGLFAGTAIINEGSVLFEGGASTFYGNYFNTASATTLADGVTATFYGTVTNEGSMQGVNGGTLEFYGKVVNEGVMNYVLGQAVFHGTNGVVDTDYRQAILHGTLINHGIVLSPDDDYDGDHQDNREEYVATSDPTNPASFFRLTVVSNHPPQQIYLSPSSTGRLYSLQFSTDPSSNSWLDVPGQTNVTGGPTCLTDTNTEAASRFYRITVNLP
ncbi:MAG: hypothetical protein V2A34_12805 [Lentisphaerota bacterium]